MRRRRRHGERFAPEVDLPITPMLDMFFQILFFFVMTYRPSALEVQFPITLSASEQGGPRDVKVESPPSIDISKTPAPVTVVAKASEKGGLESLDVTTFAGEKDTIAERGGGRPQGTGIVDESTNRMIQALDRKLRQIRDQQETLAKRGGILDDRLLLRASGHLRWEETMRILDSCRRSKDGRELFPKIELDVVR